MPIPKLAFDFLHIPILKLLEIMVLLKFIEYFKYGIADIPLFAVDCTVGVTV